MLNRCMTLLFRYWTSYRYFPLKANSFASEIPILDVRLKSQPFTGYAAMRMTYLMYYVALIYTCDSVQWVKDAVDTDRHRRHHSTYGMINIILLISRDAIHFWLFAGTLIGLLPCYRLMIGTSWVYAGSIVALRMSPRVIYPAGINTQPTCVPRLAITLSSSESVTRSCNSLIRWLL